MNRFSRDLVQGMKEAADFVEGRKAGAQVHSPPQGKPELPGRGSKSAISGLQWIPPKPRPRRVFAF